MFAWKLFADLMAGYFIVLILLLQRFRYSLECGEYYLSLIILAYNGRGFAASGKGFDPQDRNL